MIVGETHMSEIITATFLNGAFVPEQAISVPAGTRVRLTVEPVDLTPAEAAIAAHRRPTSEEVTKFNEMCDRMNFKSGLRLTRDQLHERD